MNIVGRRPHTLTLVVLACALVVAGCSTLLTGTPTRASVPVGIGAADGWIPDGTRLTVDDDHPALTRLEPELLAALQTAAPAAERAGTSLRINSGWRSTEYQQWLLDQAVQEYGNYQEASRWVATPSASRHTTGQAVDVGPPESAAWLEANGAQWGLCRVFANEPWHFELLGTDNGCPELVPDASA